MDFPIRRRFAWLALTPVIVFACSEETDPPATPKCGFEGESVSCACTDGTTGAQTCLKDGTLSDCLCTGGAGEAGAPSGSGGSGGTATGGTGASAGDGGEGASDGGVGGATGGSASGGDDGAGAGGDPTGTGGKSGSGGAGGRAGSGSGGMSGECGIGDIAGCSCSGGRAGYRPCANGSFGVCVCADAGSGGMAGTAGAGGLAGGAGASGSGGGGGAGCIPDIEWCDGRDNDCNGIPDDHFACRDDAVRNTRPFTASVYFAGDSQDGYAVQQVWPTVSRSYRSEFNTYANWYQFRRTDDELFYGATFYGILRDVPGTTDPAEPIPSCTSTTVSYTGFGFDGRGALHYRCGTSLRRGSGELVADPIAAISGVFDDGRVLVLRSVGTNESVYVVLDANGVELVRFPATGFFTGSMVPRFDGTSVDGNVAYLLFNRRYDQETDEIVVYMVDEASRFRLVRRRAVPDLGVAELAVSDGTIFVQEAELIRAYLPDNSTRIVWREAEAIFVYTTVFSEQLLVGPPAP
jgi:hypothetical protein